MEAWIYPMSVGTYGSAVIGQSGTAGNQDEDFGLSSSGMLYYYKTNGMGGANITLAAPYPLSLNSWHHIALVFTGTEAMLFQDGNKVASTPWTEAWATHGINGPTIGRSLNTSYPQYVRRFHGYIDGIRITQGIARYTNHFELSTSPFPIGTTFVDEKGHTVTANGNAVISTAQSRYNEYSAYFDGTGDYLEIPNSTDFDLGTTFTVEFWFYTTVSSHVGKILSTRTGLTSGYEFSVWNQGSGNKITCERWPTGGGLQSGSTTVSTNAWNHIAFSYDGLTMRGFLNGTLDISISQSSISYTTAGQVLRIGLPVPYVEAVNGYIDDLRITKGVARYTSDFNPPPRFPSHTPTDPYYSNVVLRMPFNGAPGSTSITDEKGKVVTVVGNTQLSATQARFGPTACYFDGTGDYLTVPTSVDFNFGSSAFTIEMWVNWSNLPTNGVYGGLLGRYETGTNNRCFSVGFYNTAGVYTLDFFTNHLGTTAGNIAPLSATFTPSVGRWYHIAAVADGATRYMFINGVLQGSSAYNGVYSGSVVTTVGTIGVAYAVITGYIDDLRITKGIARYTANFTPPRAPFPNW
jgi:hypothetical protein